MQYILLMTESYEHGWENCSPNCAAVPVIKEIAEALKILRRAAKVADKAPPDSYITFPEVKGMQQFNTEFPIIWLTVDSDEMDEGATGKIVDEDWVTIMKHVGMERSFLDCTPDRWSVMGYTYDGDQMDSIQMVEYDDIYKLLKKKQE